MPIPNSSPLERDPKITFQPKPVTGDVPITINQTPETTSDPALDKYESALDSALQADEGFKSLRTLVDQKCEALHIPVDTDDFPLLSDAARRLNNDDSQDIRFETFDKALRIMDNAFLAQYGYEPSQLLYADNEGNVSRVTFPEKMDCDTVANLDLASIQEEGVQPVESIIEKQQKYTQIGLLAMLFKMLLAFLFRFTAKALKKTKLQKVPIAGRVVKKHIRWLNTQADKLMAWLKKGSDALTVGDSDLQDYLSDSETLIQNSSSECIQAAARVIKHTINWAGNQDTSKEDGVDPQALLFRPLLDRAQARHEATKFELELNLPDALKSSPKVDQMHENTKIRINYANRYLNRDITKHKG